ncbi:MULTISPECIES: DNA-binding transcriptional response regulator [Deferrisoma]
MRGVIVADGDPEARVRLVTQLRSEGCSVFATDSAAEAVAAVLRGEGPVVVVGSRVAGMSVVELLGILERCKRPLRVIVATEETRIPALRRIRQERVFYMLAKPLEADDGAEIRQAVRCALASVDTETRRRGNEEQVGMLLDPVLLRSG